MTQRDGRLPDLEEAKLDVQHAEAATKLAVGEHTELIRQTAGAMNAKKLAEVALRHKRNANCSTLSRRRSERLPS